MAYGFNNDKSKKEIVTESQIFDIADYNTLSDFFDAIFDYIDGHVYSAYSKWTNLSISDWVNTEFSFMVDSTDQSYDGIKAIQITDYGYDTVNSLPYKKTGLIFKERSVYGDRIFAVYENYAANGNVTSSVSEINTTGLKIKIFRF